MTDLDYSSPPVISREFVAAERHLVVWTWIFYGIACAIGAFALWVLVNALLRIRASRDQMVFLFLTALFFGVLFYIPFALGWRCSEARAHLLAKLRDDFLWIVYAFNAMVAICVVIVVFSLSCMGIVFTSYNKESPTPL